MNEDVINCTVDVQAQKAVDSRSHPIESAKVFCATRDTSDFDFKQALAKAAQLIKAGDAIGNIKRGVQYVVQIPLEYRTEFQSHELELMHGENSGKTWATLVRKLDNGKNKIVCNCPIAEQMTVKGNPLQSLTDTHHNLYMQNQVKELQQRIAEVYSVCQRIEQGQTDDRVGNLGSGWFDVYLALKGEPGSKRDIELALARSKISTARQQIGESFKSRLNAFAGVPEPRLFRIINEVFSFNTDYLTKKDEEFEKLQEYYELFLRATQLHAASYLACGETQQAQAVYRNAMEFLGKLDFSKLQTLRYVHSEEEMKKTFCYHAVEYVEAEMIAGMEEARPYDYLHLSVNGDELLEVFGNGKQ